MSKRSNRVLRIIFPALIVLMLSEHSYASTITFSNGTVTLAAGMVSLCWLRVEVWDCNCHLCMLVKQP